jgi:hypothetical protein
MRITVTFVIFHTRSGYAWGRFLKASIGTTIIFIITITITTTTTTTIAMGVMIMIIIVGGGGGSGVAAVIAET